MNIILQRVDDNELIRRINTAKSSVALYASGVSAVVAQALCDAVKRLRGVVKVVFDVSQKSVNMGFLEVEAVKKIWFSQWDMGTTMFYHLPGLRLGVLFIDDEEALVYVPPAKLMEDENYQQVLGCPSGLEIVEGSGLFDARAITVEPVSEMMVAQMCCGDLKPARPLSEILSEGERKVAEAEQRAEEAEKRAAEAETKAAEAEKKAVDEYKAQFKIRRVEFSVRSQPTAIGRKRATIPSMFLVGLGNEAEKKLNANYRLFPEEEEIEAYITKKYPEESIAKFAEKEKEIRDKYLLCVPRFGSYVRTKDIEQYDQAISALGELGDKVGKHVREALAAKIDDAIEGLYSILEEQWKKTKDPWIVQYRAKHPGDDRVIHDIFVAEMKNGAKGTDALVGKFVPEIHSYSTPIDEALAENEEFLTALSKILWKRNNSADDEIISLSDLIVMKPKVKSANEETHK